MLPRAAHYLFFAAMATGFILPDPPGTYNVSLAAGPLADQSRNVTQAGTTTPWTLMLSVFQPTSCKSPTAVPYMPDKTAEFQGQYLEQAFNMSEDFSQLFLSAQLPICAPQPAGCHTSPASEDFPILLLSPGWAVSRLYYSVVASAIASHGFTVITIDSPSDASIITYPDNMTYISPTTTWLQSVAREAESIRATDASFIVDQLLANTASIASLIPHLPTSPRIAMLGHSLGGAASLLAASRDHRIAAAINWDGSIFSDLASPSASPDISISQPVLLLMDAETAIPPDWEAAWPKLTGPKLWVEVNGTTHQSFSDVGVLLEAGGMVKEGDAVLEGLLGRIEGGEMVEVLAESTARWMGAAFGEKFELGSEALGEFEVVEVLREGGL